MGGRLRRIVHAYYVTMMAVRRYIFDTATLCIVHVDWLPGNMYTGRRQKVKGVFKELVEVGWHRHMTA